MPTERYVIKTPEGEQEHSAGGVAFRPAGDDFEIVVIHRAKYDDWSLPKGHLEDGESAEAAALRELEEETGIRGAVTAYVGELRYPITGKSGRPTTKVVHHFLIEAAADNDEPRTQPGETDQVRWVSLAEAETLITYEAERDLVRHAREMLDLYKEWSALEDGDL